MRAHLVIVISAVILVLCACNRQSTIRPQTTPSSAPADVIISHKNGSVSALGTIHRRRGDTVHIQLIDTDTDCFAYNASVVETPKAADGKELPFTNVVDFYTTFWGDPITVSIEARQINTSTVCAGAAEHVAGKTPGPWLVNITTDGWDLAFSGAYLADTVTDPVYALVPGKKQIDPEPAAKTAGFSVQRFKEQEDRWHRGVAAMVHVIHTDPRAFAWHDIAWAPISFGLGIGDNADVRYYLGTGIRWGDKFYLTAGPMIGSSKRLPNGLTTDTQLEANFTTNASALATLPTRTRTGFFVGVSYSFATVNANSFNGPFAAVAPKPAQAAATSQTQTPTTGNASEVAVKEESLPGSTSAKPMYKITLTNGGTAAVTGARFVHSVYPAGSTKVDCSACTTKTFARDVDTTIDLQPQQAIAFTVMTDLTGVVNPPKKELTATVTYGTAQPAVKKFTIPE